MKSLLDDHKTFAHYDEKDVYQSLLNFPAQFESSWHDSQFISLGFEITAIKNILFVGMGGSNLPAHLIQSLAPFILHHSFEIVANYRLPQYADKNTLVVLVSYSGNTEEVLSCAQDALEHKSLVVVITTGGKLKEFSHLHHWPVMVLDQKLNPSSVPRFGLGLLLGASLGLMVRLNPAAFHYIDPKQITRTLERTLDFVRRENDTGVNPAKSLALKNKGQAITIISANHLIGSAKVGLNFINETAKTYANSFSIPDLNHHLLEGLAFPLSLKDNTRFLLLNSNIYPRAIQNRFQITKEILLKQQYQLTMISPEATDPVAQVFESLVFLSMFSYYLSIVNKQDPSTNPWVDHFKKQLS